MILTTSSMGFRLTLATGLFILSACARPVSGPDTTDEISVSPIEVSVDPVTGAIRPAPDLSPATTPAASPVAVPVTTAVEVGLLVNMQRQKMGLQSLQADAALNRLAQEYANDMFRRNYFSHTNPEGLSLGDRMRRIGWKYGWAGENIARGQKSSQEVMIDWMNSPGHRANILQSHYKRIGIAVSATFGFRSFRIKRARRIAKRFVATRAGAEGLPTQ